MQEYADENLLMLSGIQHIAFCERQFALAYIEMHWAENQFTVEGHHLHERVDDPLLAETRGSTTTLHSLMLTSKSLGLYGRADVVELIRTGDTDESGVQFSGKTGKWRLLPVEYKRGKPKPDERDAVQLCAQAICLEEMFKTRISSGYLYYGETRHRHEVDFNVDLRVLTSRLALRMHELYRKGTTPPAIYKPHCRSCSLVDICLPRAMGNPLIGSAYLNSTFESNI